MSSTPAVYAISEREPEWPCFMWHREFHFWIRAEREQSFLPGYDKVYSHWHTIQDDFPQVGPFPTPPQGSPEDDDPVTERELGAPDKVALPRTPLPPEVREACGRLRATDGATASLGSYRVVVDRPDLRLLLDYVEGGR